MKIVTGNRFGSKKGLFIIGFFEEEKNYSQPFKELGKEIEEKVKAKIFAKTFGETYSTVVRGNKVIVLGFGKKQDLHLEKVRRLFGKTISLTKAAKMESVSTSLVENLAKAKNFDQKRLGQAVAEGLILSNYTFDKYLSKERKNKQKSVQNVYLQFSGTKKFQEGLKIGTIIAEATNFARDLVEEPASVANSSYLEKVAAKIASANPKISLNVLNKAELKQLGMNALLGVNAGSENPPKLLVLEYKGGSGKPIAFVGKGITFDSGGYNLKPTKYIEEMKDDMSGAAAVISTIKAAAELKINKHLLGIVPLCENMVSGSAQKPGDIVKAYNGKTIEIGNTDAEGRLILADALAYTENKYKPEIIIDLATLTGACVIALGYYAAGLIGKDEKLLDALKKAGDDSGDRVWPLPFYEEYQDWMDGSISDLNNLSTKGKGYEAGSITAAVFLSKFVDKSKWAHLDLSGAYWPMGSDYFDKGATGSGTRIMLYYLLNN